MANQTTTIAPTGIEKLPPQNIEAEQAVLGSLLIDKEAVLKIADLVGPEDFYRDVHRMIFESMLDVYGKHEPIDIVSLTNRLEERKQLETVGGRTYLASLASVVPTAAHIVYYAGIVQKKATLRRLISAASKILELGYSETDDVEVLLDRAESALFTVSQKYLKQHFIPIKTLITEAFDRIDEIHRQGGKLRGTPTGFSDLDHMLAGLQRSDLIVIASRPSVGKTSLALDIVRNIAVQSKVPVGVFSLEMSKEQLIDRMLCAQAGVDSWKLRTGRLGDEGEHDDFARIGHAMAELSEAPIFIDDSAIVNVMEIRTKARRLQSEQGLGLLVIDYLQLMDASAAIENRVQQISEITRALKGIARELNIPLIALSQLSRAVEMRSPAIPKLADLRESGSIEQDADVVLFIYRAAMDRTVKMVTPERQHIAEIHVAKHRNGPTGSLELFFDETKVSFKSIESRREANAEAPF